MKKILIIGGTGFLGRHLVEFYEKLGHQVGVFSRDEAKHWDLMRKHPNVKSYLGDVTRLEDLNICFSQFQPTHVIIAAAMKNIVLVEKHPFQGVKTNILGLENILRCCDNYKDLVQNVVFVSTDKAAEPKNIYGMTKAICEKICLEYKSNYRINVVRYGNVLNSTGSIIPILKSTQGNYQLTDDRMTRFIMTVQESVDLINFVLMSETADRFLSIPLLKSMRIKDLLEIYAEKYNKSIEISGIRLGEKIHEKLLSVEESSLAYYYDNYVVICNNNVYATRGHVNSDFFDSKNVCISKEELKAYLIQHDLL